MTLKSIDSVTVTVTNTQSDGAASDTITERGRGTRREKNGTLYIAYKTDGANVMIKAGTDFVTVRRVGDTKSEMRYELGKTTGFMYKTPYGEMDMKIFTEAIKKDDNSVHLEYILDTGIDKVRNNIIIETER